MNESKPLFYTLRFAVLSCLFCLLILFCGLLFGTYLKNANKKSKDAFVAHEGTVFVIDAGHGGEDAGAIADDGTLEKDLNLQIASMLCALLELNGNAVRMTRTEDTLLYDYYNDLDDYTGQKKVYDLKNRLKIAEEYENSIYVGIHINKFAQPKYSGLQVYYSKNVKSSLSLANRIKNKTKQYLQKDNMREVKMASSSIYILDKIDRPAVLIECGFLSNENELKDLKNKSYQSKLALCIFSSLIPCDIEN